MRSRSITSSTHSLVPMLALLALIMGLPQVLRAASPRYVFVGDEIPRRLYVGSHYIFHQSDSLYLNDRLLTAGIDYDFDSRTQAFDLSGLDPREHDTLTVAYRKLPSWLAETYGQPPEQPPESIRSQDQPRPTFPSTYSATQVSNVTISGAKTFRFSTRSSGSSEFSQSLDMTLNGPLTDNLMLTGTISDRGYDPSYGTANSRLSELDKINLKLTSPSLRIEVGDMAYASPGTARSQRLSGAAFDLKQRHWALDALAARPKGRYATARFDGQDNLQGPYQVGVRAAAEAIVPGSETVWLDGRQLTRGSDYDYTIDYAAGRITFSVRQPIDSRSRIEIDYEPLATDYKGELISGGGGISLADSAINFNFMVLREGDDQNQPLFGELAQADREQLAAAGDSASLAFRSGVSPDSTGAYELAVEYLPDSVYRYVGEGNGEFAVSFTYVGDSLGDYRFLGSGVYQYEGAGEADYLPLVRLTAPVRTDHMQARLSVRNANWGELSAEVRASQYDKNLFSEINDDDNSGQFYRLRSVRRWRENDSLTYSGRHRAAGYRSRERLFPTDLTRNYLLPEDTSTEVEQTLHEISTALNPHRMIGVEIGFAQLSYDDVFRARAYDMALTGKWHPRLKTEIAGRIVRAELDSLDHNSHGRADNVDGHAEYLVRPQLTLKAEYEHDYRSQDYREGRGAEYARYFVGLSGAHETLSLERYDEDSLGLDAFKYSKRDRLSVSSQRRIRGLSYTANLTRQWLENERASEAQLLSRLSYLYRSSRARLDIGGAYAISDESRNARGITYVQVESGEGDHILVDGAYVPDPDGDYLRLEEILSDQAAVRRGEKSFHVAKTWGGVALRFDANIEEELKDDGERSWSWLVPFLSDDAQPYLYYLRTYRSELGLIPLGGGHAVNLNYSESLQMREVAAANRRSLNRDFVTTLRQQVGKLRFEQRLRLFRIDRDEYYSGAGEIHGYKATVRLRRLLSSAEIGLGASRRDASTTVDERSDTWAVDLSARLHMARTGEFRGSLELYRQQLNGLSGTPSYSLTDNRSGERGALWSVSARYGAPSGVRLNLSLTGRHSDDRTGRVTARGEFVAGF